MDDLRQQRHYSGGSSGERGKSVSLARVEVWTWTKIFSRWRLCHPVALYCYWEAWLFYWWSGNVLFSCFLNFKARTVHIYKTCIMKTGFTETTTSTRLTSLPPRKLPLFTLPCWYLFSLSDLFISRFVHDGKIHTVALTWASLLSVCHSGHCCNLLCFNPQEDSMHPPTRACQALLGLLAWRRTVWLKTTAVLFSHPVRQSNIIFEELHNKYSGFTLIQYLY